MSAAVFDERADEPGRAASIFLAAAMHVLLLIVLLFGVRWQNRPPEAVEVQLWEPPPPAPVVAEPPKPAPKVEAPPPPKPEPEIQKPDIVEKKAPPPPPKPEPKKAEPKPEPKPKPVAKAEPKPVPKAEPLKPRVDDFQKRMREEAARELALNRESSQIQEQLARDAASANTKVLAGWIDKVRAKIRGNIVLPPEIKGNPEAIFDVVQLPTGEVIDVRLRKSSGHRAYDEAVERAIRKSSPLPKPDAGMAFQRALELRFRPLD